MVKSFKQFIRESSWDKLVYHATYNPDFDPKKPPAGTHFGTLHAAMARGYATRSSPPNSKRRQLKVHAFKFTPSGKNASVPDLTPGDAKQVWDHLVKKKVVDRYSPSDIKGLLRGGEKTPSYKLKRNKISHVSYKNKVEDPGSTSHIVYDTKSLKHVHTFEHPAFVNRNFSKPIKDPMAKDWRNLYPYFSKSKAQRKVK